VVSAISRTLTRLLAGRERAPITLESLLQHVKAAEDVGVVESFEEEMVRNVFRINDTPVEAIMTHRMEVFVLDEETPVVEALRVMLEAGHTRVPVFKDHSEHVSGIVTLRDVAGAVRAGTGDSLKSILTEPFIVPGTIKVHELLFRMKRENLNLAVVLDEYGGLDGVVTREDVIEEIFGELYDEHEETDEEPVKPVGDGVWILQGDADFWDIKDAMGIDLEHDERTHTVGGYLMERLGEIPVGGKIVTLPEGTYEVLETKQNRIVSLRFRPTLREEEEET
jgi:CBS domain containing-hemolysin-like protein